MDKRKILAAYHTAKSKYHEGRAASLNKTGEYDLAKRHFRAADKHREAKQYAESQASDIKVEGESSDAEGSSQMAHQEEKLHFSKKQILDDAAQRMKEREIIARYRRPPRPEETGPRGGRYYVTEGGRKIYLRGA